MLYSRTTNYYFLAYDELCKIIQHNTRVMGLVWIYKYYCGSDNKFILSEINYLSNLSYSQSNAGYTNLEFDKKNERIFLY